MVNSKKDAIFCTRCGHCCQAHISLIATRNDIQRWRREGRADILRVVEHPETVHGYNDLGDGAYLTACPFLIREKGQHTCTIYETRPQTCRNFQPGSERCLQTIQHAHATA